MSINNAPRENMKRMREETDEKFQRLTTTERPATVGDLRRRYNEAVTRGEEVFAIDGLKVLTSYAKCTLQLFEENNIPDTNYLRDQMMAGELMIPSTYGGDGHGR